MPETQKPKKSSHREPKNEKRLIAGKQLLISFEMSFSKFLIKSRMEKKQPKEAVFCLEVSVRIFTRTREFRHLQTFSCL